MTEYVMDYSPSEMIVVAGARLLEDNKVIFAGTGLPMVGVTLAQLTHGPGIVPVFEAVQVEAAKEAPLTQSPETSAQNSIIEETVIVSTSPPEVPTKAKEIEIPLLRDPEMKLQAITWSKDPQKRIVVINNRILREGETVSGYRIETINQDDIILGENGEKWKFLFRIK